LALMWVVEFALELGPCFLRLHKFSPAGVFGKHPAQALRRLASRRLVLRPHQHLPLALLLSCLGHIPPSESFAPANCIVFIFLHGLVFLVGLRHPRFCTCRQQQGLPRQDMTADFVLDSMHHFVNFLYPVVNYVHLDRGLWYPRP